ncbi:MAG: NTP transferase domain-containing protein, partial [Oscillospiraceae bacterium]|nr:NTP transferase domain-containing protein [Oscillospiraceae bacterium]
MIGLKLGCLVMAAGNASRFGKNKLAADFGGATLITRALRTIPRERFERITVVTQYDEIAALAEEF